MIRHVVIGSVLLLAACGGVQSGGRNATGPAGGSEVRLEPGEWEIKLESVKIEGAPPDVTAAMAAAKGSVQRQCIGPEEAGEMFGAASREGCKGDGDRFRNGRIGKLICTSGDPPSGHEISGSYTARSFDITNKIIQAMDGGTVTTESRSTGRRIGDCPAGKKS